MRRLLPLRPARVALAGLAFVLLVAVGSTSAAQSSSSEPSLQLTLASQTNWVGPDGNFQITVSAAGMPATVDLQMNFYARVTRNDGLEAAASGKPLGEIRYQKSLKGAATSNGSISATLDAADAERFSTGGGLYPLEIRVSAPGEQAALGRLVTTMIRLAPPAGAGSAPLAVGVVVPIQAPASPGVDGSPLLDEAAAKHLTAIIDAVSKPTLINLTLSPSAESLLLLSERGDGGRESVEELKGAPAQILSGPYASLDAGAWLDSGLGPEMDHQYQQGLATLTDLLDRTTSQLSVLDRSVTPDALAHLQDLGTTAVVSPSGQLAPLSSAAATEAFAQQFRISTGDDRSIDAVAASDAAGNRLRPGGDPVLAAHQALAELAYLDQVQNGAPSRGVAVIVPADIAPQTLTTFLDALADPAGTASGAAGAPAVSPTNLAGLFVATTPTGDRTTERTYEGDPPADLGSYPDELREAGRSYTGLVSFTPEAQDLHVPVDRTLMSSGARDLDDDDRTAMVDGAIGSIQAATSEVVVTPEQIVTLTSSSGNVPLNLENRLPYRAEVRIQMASDKLDFPQGSVIQETLDPAHTTTIELPVETRATGAFPLTVTISSADGTLPVATTRYTVRSTAISGVGLVLSIGAGLFLLVWWARHWRTSRRAKTLVASTHPALSATEPDGYAPPDTDPLEGR